jgi:3-oxoacid CoA-transferase A subunit
MINKIYPDFKDAVSDIPDGATIIIGGHGGPVGMPQNLILALRDQGAKELTLINNTGGMCEIKLSGSIWADYVDHAILFQNRQVRKMIGSFLGSPIPGKETSFDRLKKTGEVEIEIMSQGTLAARLLAGGAGYGGIYTQAGVGTVLEEGKEKKIINGVEYLLELPLRADYALVKAHVADKLGNLSYRLTARNANPLAAKAARTTIVEVDQIVEPGELAPDSVVTPAIYVHRIVKIPGGRNENSSR